MVLPLRGRMRFCEQESVALATFSFIDLHSEEDPPENRLAKCQASTVDPRRQLCGLRMKNRLIRRSDLRLGLLEDAKAQDENLIRARRSKKSVRER